MDSEMHGQKEDIVISGVACRLPESRNVKEFWENLINGVDMVTEDDRRWPPGLHGLPKRNGKIPDIFSFDADFFGVAPKQADSMDPQLRLLLEVAYEAIVDSGCSFQDLSSGSTGVYIGISSNDGHDLLSHGDSKSFSGYEMTGGHRTMFANRLSYFFDLKGPSMTVDTACSSGLTSLYLAMSAIREGRIDRALVGASGLLLKPEYSLQFFKLKMLSPDGTCKSFDSSANGYCRSEGVVVMLIEKEDLAVQSYLTLIDALASSDGYKAQGITYPSADAQYSLLRDIYTRSNVDLNTVTYVEAHGTGTAVGDPIELNTIAAVMANNRKEPLLVGSVKSNMGHSEAVSGLAGLLKVILAHQHGILPKNLHFNEPNPNIPSLKDGRLKVVDEHTQWNGGIVCISAYGFGGANAHVIAKTPPNIDDIRSGDAKVEHKDIPLIMFCCGNTEATVNNCLEVASKTENINAMRLLLRDQSVDKLSRQPARGFVIPELGLLETHLNKNTQERRPLWFIYPGMGSQWPGMGRELMCISEFKETIDRCHKALKSEGFDLLSLLHSDDESIYDDPQNAAVAICAIQLALTNLLHTLDVRPDGIIGHSVGELGCAFADGTLTVEQTIAAAYWRGQSIKDANLPKGAMAAVGLTWEECSQSCPEGVVPACNNATGSVTISGPLDKVQNFVEQLKQKGVFAKEVNSSGIAYHSYFMERCAEPLKRALQKIIPTPIKRSKRWISSSIPEVNWNSNLAEYSSAEYHVNNVVSPVLFKEALRHVPDNAVVLEIGPHALLKAALKREISTNGIHLSTMLKQNDKNMQHLLVNIGRCYIHGISPNLEKLYGPLERKNYKPAMLGNCVQWNHQETWNVPKYTASNKTTDMGYMVEVDISKDMDPFLKDHVIDGRIVYPAAGYFVMAWEAFAKQQNVKKEDLNVVFRDVRIHEALFLKHGEKYKFKVEIAKITGQFHITEGESLKCTGEIMRANANQLKDKDNPQLTEPCTLERIDESIELSKTDVYQELRLRGYEYGPAFQTVQHYDILGNDGIISHQNNWVTFLDALLHLTIVAQYSTKALRIPTRIDEIIINPSNKKPRNQEINVRYEKHLSKIYTDVASIRHLKTITAPLSQKNDKPTLDEYRFEPYVSDNEPLELAVDGKSETDRKVESMKRNIKILLETAMENRPKFNHRMNILAEIDTQPGIESLNQLIEIAQSLAFCQFQFSILDSDIVTRSNIAGKYPGYVKIITKHDLSKSQVVRTDLLFCDNFTSNGLFSEMKKNTLIFLQTSTKQAGNLALIENNLQENSLQVIASSGLGEETKLMLLRTKPETPLKTHVIDVDDDEYEWVTKLKDTISMVVEKPEARVWLISRQNKATGLAGFMLSLVQELKVSNIRCLINNSNDMEILPNEYLPGHTEFDSLVQRDVFMNVYKDCVIGSFKRTSVFKSDVNEKVEDVFLDIQVKGDLSSLRWIEMPPQEINDDSDNNDVIYVTHSALNFRDVMLASGRIPIETVPEEARNGESILGLEYAGFDQRGHRRFGMNLNTCLATRVKSKQFQSWPVPSNWTLAQAATISTAYVTAYYALVIRGSIKPKDRVLIHSATSGVGQAALRIVNAMGCEVYATAGTQTKRQYLETVCGIEPSHIANSRDVSFVEKFLKATEGKGMNIVLNSLSDEKFSAGLDLIADNGTFLEIGKYDLFENTKLGLSIFLKNTSFHGIQIERILLNDDPDLSRVHKLIEEGISNNVVVPIKHAIFHREDVESAFRYMAEGEHIGKIVLKMHDLEEDAVQSGRLSLQKFEALRKTYLYSNKVYIITGGLGGLGLELANWLVKRGAKNLILTSRSGLKTGYQRYMVKNWKDQGINVEISKRDVRIKEDTRLLFEEAVKMGPVGGVFHLAAVLNDGLFNLQTPETFRTVCDIKVKGIDNLDCFTRQLCNESLDHFVAFSSSTAAFGNAGQTSYGFANSYMERVCEKRVQNGYPGKAIQWGFIGDVGIVQNYLGGNDHSHNNMITQRIPSFLETLDIFLISPGTVYSSVVFKQQSKENIESGDVGEEALTAVAKILGLRDMSKVNKNVTFVEMGLDSLMGTEIRQVFARRFGIQLSMAEVQNLTLDSIGTLFSN